VTALRSFLEERGSDFSANLSGKLKMVLQCVAAGSALVYLDCLTHSTAPRWVYLDYLTHSTAPRLVCWITIVSIWSAVVLTVYSGAIYVWIAYKLLKQKTDTPDA
jgi:CDP-diacylglycerol--glycerol-3-phosphate 3-phosphatidyltransferase